MSPNVPSLIFGLKRSVNALSVPTPIDTHVGRMEINRDGMRRRLIYVMQVNEGHRCPGGKAEGAGVAGLATAAP